MQIHAPTIKPVNICDWHVVVCGVTFEEVVIENVRVLSDGEAVSIDGTHLGHNLPDGKGNRNLF